MKVGKDIKIPIKHLQRIAEYYEFPTAVFFAPTAVFKGRTRNKALSKKAEAFDKIKEIVEDMKFKPEKTGKAKAKAINLYEKPISQPDLENKKLEEEYGKILDDFIEEERAKFRAGSGDDMFFEEQVIRYVNSQREFWLSAIKKWLGKEK